ncbi:MAG: helix-turn-helix domain-containing protein [Candidatus Uhrbacteria bacterium]|nr:helix-turn-helix domain-containing protein [Candidatus Uhrbacteria bacterium]
MTVSDAARRLRVSRQRAMELIDEGRIGQTVYGKRTIDIEKLDQWEHSTDRLKYKWHGPVSVFVSESERIRAGGEAKTKEGAMVKDEQKKYHIMSIKVSTAERRPRWLGDIEEGGWELVGVQPSKRGYTHWRFRLPIGGKNNPTA